MNVDSYNMPVPSSCVVCYVILHATVELRYIHTWLCTVKMLYNRTE